MTKFKRLDWIYKPGSAAILGLAILITGCTDSTQAGFGLLFEPKASTSPGVVPFRPDDFTDEQIAAAKKHPAFTQLKDADLILIGQTGFRLEAILESFPAHYQYRVTVKTDLALPARIEKGKKVRGELSITSETDPKVPDGIVCVVALAGKTRPRVIFHAESTEELIRTAKIAHMLKTKAVNDGLKMAKEKPEQHSLFKALQKSEAVAIVSENTDPNGTVTFDARTRRSISLCQIEFVFKGKLEAESNRKLLFKNGQPKIESGNRFLITCTKKGKQVQVDQVIPITEESKAILFALYNKQLSDDDRKTLSEIFK